MEKRLFGILSRAAMFVCERLGYNLNILGSTTFFWVNQEF